MKFPSRDPGRMTAKSDAADQPTWPESKAEIIKTAMLSAAGLPALVLFFSMAGYGSMCRQFGLPVEVAAFSTLAIWGLPGQIAMVEMMAIGAPMVAVALAVTVANARFMPMTMALLPHMQVTGHARWWYYLLAQFISLNPWAAAMRNCPTMPLNLRLPYFFAFAIICVSAATLGTVVGYEATTALPRPIILGLIFLNPAYFALVFADVRTRSGALALAFGAPMGPIAHMVSPEWGLPIAGLVAGTLAFVVDNKMRDRPAAKERFHD